MQRLIAERPGRLAIVAGRNDIKMDLIARLHAEGFCVLGDKPWIIRSDQLEALRTTASTPPLAMDIMTERREVAVRLQHALIRNEDVFGAFDVEGDAPAVSLQSVHFLYKLVNGRPLVRPAWYFDTRVQGEGMTDVNTHLVDLAQWFIGDERPFDYERDIQLISAVQWPTEVPLELFRQITGLADFPDPLRADVVNDRLRYLCNARLSCRMRGVPVRAEALWGLTIPEGGGDTHEIAARGTRATIVVRLDQTTRFRTQLTVHPAIPDARFGDRLAKALESFQDRFPGVSAEAVGDAFCITIPDALRTTHEEHFAVVLDAFIGYADSGQWPANLGPDLIAKYTLLERAREMANPDR